DNEPGVAVEVVLVVVGRIELAVRVVPLVLTGGLEEERLVRDDAEPQGRIGRRDGEDVIEDGDRLPGGRWGGNPEPDRRRVRIRRIHVDPGVISAGGQGRDRWHGAGPRM